MAAQLACAFRRGGVGAVDINVKKIGFLACRVFVCDYTTT